MSMEAELRQASDRLLEQLTHLAELESAKRDAMPGTPEFVELSRQVEAVAAEVLGTTQQQSHLAAASRVLREAGSPETPTAPISETSPLRDPWVVLSDWRDAERRLATAAEGSAEREAARAEVERLRDEYRASFEARR